MLTCLHTVNITIMFCFHFSLLRSKKKQMKIEQEESSFVPQHFYLTTKSVESLPKLDSYERIYNWLCHSDNQDQNISYSEESDFNENISEEEYEEEVRRTSFKTFQQRWFNRCKTNMKVSATTLV